MRCEEGQILDEAIKGIAALLALAFKRRARMPLVRITPEQIPDSLHLANEWETSVHEVEVDRYEKGV